MQKGPNANVVGGAPEEELNNEKRGPSVTQVPKRQGGLCGEAGKDPNPVERGCKGAAVEQTAHDRHRLRHHETRPRPRNDAAACRAPDQLLLGRFGQFAHVVGAHHDVTNGCD